MIKEFQGEYRWLSNMYKVPIQTTIGDNKIIEWKSTEHMYQAMKCVKPKDQEYIYNLESPYEAKKYARTVEMRKDWDTIKLGAMTHITYLKYSQHSNMASKLLATGDQDIEEGNTWHDNYWGVCSCYKCENKIGLNHLGEILMDIRSELKHEMEG